MSFSRAAPVGVRFGLGRVPLTQYRLIEGRSKETSFGGESRGRQQHLRGCDLTVWCGMHVCRWLDVTCMCGRDHAPSRKRQVAETREPETPQMPDPAPGPHRDPTLPRKPWKSFNVNRDGHPRVCMCIAPVNPRTKVSFTPRRSSSSDETLWGKTRQRRPRPLCRRLARHARK